MVELRKATLDDFDLLYELLMEFKNPNMNKQSWRLFFENIWNSDEEFCGYMLVDGKRAVGYLAYIFSNRLIDGKNHNFCNISSWIILKPYRNEHKMKVLDPVKELIGYTITGFAPTKPAYINEKKVGFNDLETGNVLAYSNPLASGGGANLSITNKPEVLEKTLSEEGLRIFNDHRQFKVDHVLIQTDEGDLYLVLNPKRRPLPYGLSRISKREITIGEIYHLSNRKLFERYFHQILNRINKIGYSGLIVDRRFADVPEGRLTKERIFKVPHIFISDTLPPEKIDYLYSEKFFLYHHPYN